MNKQVKETLKFSIEVSNDYLTRPNDGSMMIRLILLNQLAIMQVLSEMSDD